MKRFFYWGSRELVTCSGNTTSIVQPNSSDSDTVISDYPVQDKSHLYCHGHRWHSDASITLELLCSYKYRLILPLFKGVCAIYSCVTPCLKQIPKQPTAVHCLPCRSLPELFFLYTFPHLFFKLLLQVQLRHCATYLTCTGIRNIVIIMLNIFQEGLVFLTGPWIVLVLHTNSFVTSLDLHPSLLLALNEMSCFSLFSQTHTWNTSPSMVV